MLVLLVILGALYNLQYTVVNILRDRQRLLTLTASRGSVTSTVRATRKYLYTMLLRLVTAKGAVQFAIQKGLIFYAIASDTCHCKLLVEALFTLADTFHFSVPNWITRIFTASERGQSPFFWQVTRRLSSLATRS